MILEEGLHPLLADQEILMAQYRHGAHHTIELEEEQELRMVCRIELTQTVCVQEPQIESMAPIQTTHGAPLADIIIMIPDHETVQVRYLVQ